MASVNTLNCGCVKELAKFLFWDRITSDTFMNGGRFLHLILEPSRGKTETVLFEYDNINLFRGYHILSKLVCV